MTFLGKAILSDFSRLFVERIAASPAPSPEHGDQLHCRQYIPSQTLPSTRRSGGADTGLDKASNVTAIAVFASRSW